MRNLKKRIPKKTKHNLDAQFRVADIEEDTQGMLYTIDNECLFCEDMIRGKDMCNARCPFSGGYRFTCRIENWFQKVMAREKVYNLDEHETITFTGAQTLVHAPNKRAAIALVRRARKALKKHIEWV